jgi:hypothetical protein
LSFGSPERPSIPKPEQGKTNDRIVDDVPECRGSAGGNARRHRHGHFAKLRTAPAHAHLNLIGGVLLFLFGLYYRLVPAAGSTTLAKVQGWLHMAGAIVFPAGIAAVLLKGPSVEAAPIAGSLIVVAAMALFAVIVFRTARA